MASVNKVILVGNLGADPELRQTASQNSVATLSVATTDSRTDRDGVRQEFTEWHRVVVWGRQAENCAKYLSKGRSIYLEGRLQTRSWEDKNGVKRYTTEIVATTVQFLGGGTSKDQGSSYGANSQDNYSQQGGHNDFNAGMAGSLGGPETPSLDDIPF